MNQRSQPEQAPALPTGRLTLRTWLEVAFPVRIAVRLRTGFARADEAAWRSATGLLPGVSVTVHPAAKNKRTKHMNPFCKNFILSIGLVGLLLPLAGSADTINLGASADTFMSLRNPDFNAGGHTFFDVGTDGGGYARRGLLSFDLSGIAAGSTITSAVLTLTVVKFPAGSPTSDLTLHRVNAAWNEGNKAGNNGALATTGEATWNSRQHAVASWTAAGALADASSSPSATTSVPAALVSFTWTGGGMVSDLQQWLDNPSQNFGWLLRSQAEEMWFSVRAFGSKESATKPTLVVGYTPAPSTNVPPTVSLTAPTNGASFGSGSGITIEATAADADGTVTNVQFFANGASLGNDTTAPYSVTASFFPGNLSLTAVASDNKGATTTSGAVTISVGSVPIANPIAQRVPKGMVKVELQTVADGMASPIAMSVPDDGSGRMFVYDQDGRIWVVLTNGTRLATPLLDLSTNIVLTGAYDERGLLGVAVHPNFAQNPLIYTYTSEPTNGVADFPTGITNNHQSVISEWRISTGNSNLVDRTSRRELMRIDQPQSNHNGGAMHFGPDGLLYVTLGDGGQSNDVGPGHVPGGNAQALNRIWGKLIRIDVDTRNSANGKYGIPPTNPFVGANALPEIYAYGLRNPFTFSFDRGTGQLYLADVGQNRVEEINLITKGGNYGWNLREAAFWFDSTSGTVVTGPVRPYPEGMIDPIAQYDHDDGSAVIGGYVYRGTALPGLAGTYVFGDWGSFGTPSGRLYYLDATNGVNEVIIGNDDRLLGLWLKGFGEGPDGELYVFATRWLGPSGSTGRMLKIVPAVSQATLGSFSFSGGTNATVAWAGGMGPFALQKKTALDEPVWTQAAVTNQRIATAPHASSSGYFRVRDAARLPSIPLTAYLSGGGENPGNNSSGTGLGIMALDGNTLTFTINYSGLSAPATAGHIHGPAPASTNASVLIDLAPFNGTGWSTTGSLSGVIVLTDAQKAHLLAGRTYVNLHTTNFPAGEIRGQIAPVNMQAVLSGANETSPVDTPARGLGNLALVGNRLTMNVTYSGLTGPASAAHIHGPAVPGQDATVLINLASLNGGAYGASGSLSGTVTLTPQQLAYVIDGRTYINFHTAVNGGGEIRGQIVPAVSGVPGTALLSGLAEKPTALTNSASGDATLSLDGNVLTFNVAYRGLSASAMAAHIHGSTNTSANATVMIDLSPFKGGGFGTEGTFSGSVILTTAQRNALLTGQTYINVHTGNNPGGEIRGQIAPVIMTSGLNGRNERTTAVATGGQGMATFALVRDQLTMVLAYSGLSGPATASHIHGPAGILATGNVLVNLAGLAVGGYGASGALSGTVSLALPQLLSVIDGNTYVNFHTVANASGEIRGQIMR